MAMKAPRNVLATRRNRYTLVHASRDPIEERRRARSTIATTVARPIKSTIVVATLLYATTIYFPKTPRRISSFVQTSLLEQRNVQQQIRSSIRKLYSTKSVLRRRSSERAFKRVVPLYIYTSTISIIALGRINQPTSVLESV